MIMTVAKPDLARDEVFATWGEATAALFSKVLEQLDTEAAARVDALVGAGATFALTATLEPPAVRGLLEVPGAEPMTLFEIAAPDEGPSGELH